MARADTGDIPKADPSSDGIDWSICRTNEVQQDTTRFGCEGSPLTRRHWLRTNRRLPFGGIHRRQRIGLFMAIDGTQL
jgi:hypothetical protein